MGSKAADCADSKCGDWSYEREYFVTLPQGYDRAKAYPLILQGSGCGATGKDAYSLNNNVDNTVIRVGLTPPPHAIGHATLPNQGCFDDHEGDDSVDWVFYENLYDKLAALYCFDRNRVFAAGRSTGAMFANELGCKYAGDASRPIRGIVPHSGGLPTEAQFVPTCTTKPMAGIWIHVVADTTYPFAGTKVAIARAMQVNGCTVGTSYETAQFVDVPIGGGLPDNLCRRITGCPVLYPLVVCPLPGDERGTRENVVNPAASAFVKMFAAP